VNQEINALIIGGGIAGLSTAIVLGQQNIKATVIEITNRSALGASVAINNRAVDALESLGVLEKCIEAGTAFDSKTSIFENMFDSAGNPLSFPSPPGRPDDRLPASIQIYRPTFAQILQEKAEKLGATIKLNTSFTEIENSGNKVNVTFTPSPTTLKRRLTWLLVPTVFAPRCVRNILIAILSQSLPNRQLYDGCIAANSTVSMECTIILRHQTSC